MPAMYAWILIYLLAINALAFLSFGWDKRCAARGKRRTPEARLLFLALILGSPGAWLGVSFFRHKSSKPSFLAKLLVATLAGTLGAWAVWHHVPR